MTAVLVTIGSATIHGLWVYWARFVAGGHAVKAGLTTVAIDSIGFAALFQYIADSRLVFAYLVGSFIGATISVRFSNRDTGKDGD